MKIVQIALFWVGLALAASGQAQVTLKDISDTVADLRCDNSNQCKAIGVGKRQCGGPANFTIYSSKTVDEARLESLVSQYNDSISFPPNSAGICVFATMPVAACIANTCKSTVDGTVAYAGSGNTMVVNIPNVVYVKNMEGVKAANGVYHEQADAKEVYWVRLESFIDDKDGQLKFKIQQLIKQP